MFAASSFKNKKVAIFGLARSGISCAQALTAGGAEVFAWDDSELAVEKARADGLAITNLHMIDFKTLDNLVLSPGVPLTHPEPHWTVVKAKQAGIEIIGDTEVFAREVQGTGAKIVAITGTNGKSTTTALIGHVLKSAGLDVDVGGNIGLAVFNLQPPVKGRVYVLELSSFQIDLMPNLKPDVGILTNLTPDHLDRHGTMENYASVKARMFKHTGSAQTALICVDDEWCVKIADGVRGSIHVSVLKDLPEGISAPQGILKDWQASEIDLRDMPALKGRHNWQNACMAYGAARALGVPVYVIVSAMKSFPGLAHRMQQVGVVNGVPYVNDSKATNADAAEKALASFDQIYWIAGGISKAGGIEPLQPYFSKIAKAYLIGAAATDFAETLKGKVNFVISETMERAVIAAAADAKRGGVVLLSPACASFDHYKNFEVRGDAFVQLVSQLPGAVMADGGKN
jgi:UDP-N-acetylmuramoylalanine--D-glutamate ligase